MIHMRRPHQGSALGPGPISIIGRVSVICYDLLIALAHACIYCNYITVYITQVEWGHMVEWEPQGP